MNAKFSSFFLSPTEQSALPPFSDDENLLNFLIGHKYILVTDWKTEDEPFQIGNFIKTRLQILHPGLVPDFESIYKSMQEQLYSLQVGDSIPFLLNGFQAVFKKAGYTIVLLDRGNDNYYIGLVSSSNAKDLKRRSTSYWRWKALGDLSGEVLYTVYCSCGSMNVWQVKRGDIITDDTCQDCGREIFDKHGNSAFQIIKDYI